MKENTAASVQEFVWQWQRSRQVMQPTEVERAMAAWRPEKTAHQRRPWRQTIARGLMVLAIQFAPNVVVEEAAMVR